ncbi:hypothetical protein QBC46DRAFT_384750 [Diplogelasinospora grovesii]|uniref:Secreted protein n=1 Tax=Diplogelasinospora grovesii TaxID=303347 RepID=A0AAN6S5J7_9PEZI|nr:hypothetical protein QBC46DRAFT_384750 [Diplogelasinospora grovesii]
MIPMIFLFSHLRFFRVGWALHVCPGDVSDFWCVFMVPSFWWFQGFGIRTWLEIMVGNGSRFKVQCGVFGINRQRIRASTRLLYA